MANIAVAKFGGTSVANHQAMSRCASIIKNKSTGSLVVVSAPAGVTNHLVRLSQSGLNPQEQSETIQAIRDIAFNIVDELTDRSAANLIGDHVDTILADLTTRCASQSVQFDAQNADSILACGEQISSVVFAQVLCELGVPAKSFDVRQVMKTNSLYSKAVVDIEQVASLSQSQLLPLLESDVIVTQGFIGQDGLGNTTTLGRGGSDYSAAILAEALEAENLEIWTDVEGIFTTDPRITAQAKSIPEISFGEAAEMATFGAKILHPATLIPAMRKNIPVFVGSSKAPEKGGTRIQQTVESNPTYRSIALRREQSLVTVKSPEMLHASGFLAKVFSILAKHELSVDLITTSEISVAMTFDNPTSNAQALITHEVVRELEQLCEVSVEHGLSLVAVIGNGLHAAKELGTSIFEKINDFNIRLICHGASANNICFLVPENDANSVVSQLHNTLFD